MEFEEKSRPYRRVLWGVFLMALGTLFLLERTGVIEMPSVWKFWPTALLVLGVCRLMAWRPGAAATLILMGLAFFAAEFHWLGLSYTTFWPLLLLAVGVGIVIKAVSAEEARCVRKEECCQSTEECRKPEETTHA